MTLLATDPEIMPEEEAETLSSMSDPTHSAVQGNLLVELSRHADLRVYPELDLRLLGNDSRPDLCLYRREPLNLRADEPRREDPPPVAIEVLSAKQGLSELLRRVEGCLAAGVKSCWIVVPPLRTVTIFSQDGAEKSWHEGVITDPAIGVTADLATVFS